MNFNKSLLQKQFTEQSAHSRLDAEDGLVGGCTQIQHTVVESCVLSHHYIFLYVLLVVVLFSSFLVLILFDFAFLFQI